MRVTSGVLHFQEGKSVIDFNLLFTGKLDVNPVGSRYRTHSSVVLRCVISQSNAINANIVLVHKLHNGTHHSVLLHI